MVNGSALPSFISVDNSSFSTNGTVNITFDIPSIGTYYNTSDLYEFNIKVNGKFHNLLDCFEQLIGSSWTG